MKTPFSSALYDPTLKRRPYCVFSSCSDQYAFCLYVSLKSFFEKSPLLAEQSDIWVAGVKVSPKHKKILESLPHVRVLDYQFPLPLPDSKAIRTFTIATLARYECFPLLQCYERVMYLDSDVLVQKELLPVFDTLTNGVGFVLDPLCTTVDRNFQKPIKEFDMSVPGYNAGFMVLNRQSNWKNRLDEIAAFLFQKTVLYARDLYLPDQGIINLAIQQFQLNPVTLPESYNCPASSPRRALKQAYIIHSTGPRKFWCYYYFADFYRHYCQWINLGGTPVTVRAQDSRLYRWLIRKTGWDRFIFVQLCPDFVARPFKALRFIYKRWRKLPF